MKVRVIPTLPETFYGFYGKRRRPGEEFELKDVVVDGKVTVLAEKQFSAKWMQIVDDSKSPASYGDSEPMESYGD